MSQGYNIIFKIIFRVDMSSNLLYKLEKLKILHIFLIKELKN